MSNGVSEETSSAAGAALTISSLDVDYVSERSSTRVLSGVGLELPQGEILGLVGESGSGKSTTIRAALRLLGDNARVRGSVEVCGTDVYGASPGELRKLRAEQVALIQQDPRNSLNPVRRIGPSMCERLVRVRGVDRATAMDRAESMLTAVGIRNPGRCLRQFPHQLSGGMLQRVVIAAGLMADPRLILADEATSALDVSTQAEVLGLIAEQQRSRNLAVLFVTHDLHLAAAMCDTVAVMRGGRVVENLAGRDLFDTAEDPYTRELLQATPILGGTQ